MVKGRRVKTMVAYARNDEDDDDSCLPNPKRKGPLLQTRTITRYFQADNYSSAIASEKDDIEDELVNVLVNNAIDLDKTPTLRDLRMDVLSPPTPHRIELCADSETLQDGNSDEVAQIPPKARQRPTKEKTAAAATNHKLTEYFPVRRSARKTKKTVLEEKQRLLEQAVRSALEHGLEVRCFQDKGRGVVATKSFGKGDFVVEYSGELVDVNESKLREQRYADDQNAGCYMYYFKHQNQQYCIDATAETGRLGRLVNHSRNGNLITKTIMIDGKPRLVLIAKDDIKAGEEINYDYGDRSKESLKHHPWLAL